MNKVEGRILEGMQLQDVLDENRILTHAIDKMRRKTFVVQAELNAAKKTETKHVDLLEV